MGLTTLGVRRRGIEAPQRFPASGRDWSAVTLGG